MTTPILLISAALLPGVAALVALLLARAASLSAISRPRWAPAAAVILLMSGTLALAAALPALWQAWLPALPLSAPSLAALAMTAATALIALVFGAALLRHRDTRADAAIDASLQLANEQLQRANAELVRRAYVDPLTGLPNRALLDDRLAQAAAGRLAGSAPGRARPAVLFVDLDGFKPVNDAYGHAVGDDLLRQVGDRLESLCRRHDTLARLGGDEFVLLLPQVEALQEATAIAARVIAALTQPFELPGRRLTLSCSIGIAAAPEHGDPSRLLAAADLAMYAAKRSGGSGWAVFEPHMEAGILEQLELQEALRDALPDDQLRLHYQPKVDARSGRLCGVEALLRWQHPVRGAISPAQFIPVAERFGLIVPIGYWVIEEACRQIAAWSAAGRRMCVSINLSGYQLRQPDLAERLRQTLARHGIDPSQLVCEITESVVMEDGQITRRVLEQLAAMGLKLSIDDFGTGYSSLASLRQLRAHELKIDRSFVRDVASDGDARAVVDAVLRLARALGLRTVAEGVETPEQRTALIALGCDELQGYHFGRPVSPESLPADGAVLPARETAASPARRPTLRRVV